ncbi:MAG TPA: DNA internalization-related competence protein ComEC/Rec2 [Planctomycetes bacterium]|nr:DNA internalization-related competence protein ComEC/Rec2 [Planctomycetota bacterium]
MDDIQRKLALIDKQLAWGPAYIHKQIISTSPLLFVVAGLIAGILVQSALTLSIGFWFVLLALCTAATVPIYLVKDKNRPFIIAYAALFCFVCLGAIRLISFYQPKTNDICKFVGDERKLATIRGVIITEPYVQKNEQWKFSRFTHSDPSSSFYLKMEEIKAVDGWAKVSGTVRAQVSGPVLDLQAGDYIQAYCWLDRFKQATNPGQFDIAKYLARKNVFIAASIKSRDGIELLKERSESIFRKIKRNLRETATQALLGDLSPENRNRGLLQALLLGYRGNIDSNTYRAFRKTGLLHFISLSGMHLGILIGTIWWLCKTAGLMKRARAAVCIIAICIFLLIVPPRAPTVRAAIIGFVFCASFFFRRRSNPVNALSLAAIILLLMRPTNLFEAGWQLSFASVLGIILFTDRIHFFIYEKITERLWFKKIPKTKLFFPIIATPWPYYLLGMFSVGLAAWLGGAGILLYHFSTISPFTSLWTVVVFPFVALILTIGYLKIILSFLLPSVAWVLGVIVTRLSDALICIVELLAHLDISQILIGHVSLVTIILYYCLVLFAAFFYFRRPLIKKAICTLMALAIILFLGVTKWQRTHRDDLVVSFLDVGHGQAILAQLPGQANVLFDAGSLHKSDIGRRIAAPFLDYKGIKRIDSIIISHNDVDHINGIPEIVEHCKVGGVYSNKAFLMEITTDEWGTAEFLDRWLSEKGPGIQPVANNLSIGGKAKIKILWPTEQICQDKTLGDNDKSVVLLIEFGGRKILLCSDIEQFAQRKFLELFPDLKVDVVVVPHHGSAKTLDTDFLKRLEAGVSICSCGRTQYEKLQANKQKNETKSFYTPRDGAITVCINKDGTIRTATFVKRK